MEEERERKEGRSERARVKTDKKNKKRNKKTVRECAYLWNGFSLTIREEEPLKEVTVSHTIHDHIYCVRC